MKYGTNANITGEVKNHITANAKIRIRTNFLFGDDVARDVTKVFCIFIEIETIEKTFLFSRIRQSTLLDQHPILRTYFRGRGKLL